ncbi:MAG: hypothetical protein QW416_08900 [Candidatus Nitrosocaldaceae archaeon]
MADEVDNWKDKNDRFKAIARIMLLAMIGMFTGYTLVSLFGLIIGGVLAFGVVWYFNKVINGSMSRGFSFSASPSPLSLSPTTSRIRIRYRCLSCYHVYTGKRECPKCGSKLKQVEF